MKTIIEDKLEGLIQPLKDFLLKDKNIQFAFIFGSYVKRTENKKSDLDIAIYFIRPPEGLDLLYLLNKLSEMSGKDVDLVVLNKASAFLRHQVIKYGIPLVIKDRITYRLFREKTITDYDEYKYISGLNDYDR